MKYCTGVIPNRIHNRHSLHKTNCDNCESISVSLFLSLLSQFLVQSCDKFCRKKYIILQLLDPVNILNIERQKILVELASKLSCQKVLASTRLYLFSIFQQTPLPGSMQKQKEILLQNCGKGTKNLFTVHLLYQYWSLVCVENHYASLINTS